MRHANLRRVRQQAEDQWFRTGLDEDVKIALLEEFERANPLARTVLDDDGFLEFLSDFISREWTKLQANKGGRPHDHPYDGDRSKPLCTCRDRYCPLKQGQLPRPIRAAENPRDALRTFKHEHAGDPLVLQDASRTFADRCARFDVLHRRIIVCAQHNVHPDELEGRLARDAAEVEQDEAAAEDQNQNQNQDKDKDPDKGKGEDEDEDESGGGGDGEDEDKRTGEDGDEADSEETTPEDAQPTDEGATTAHSDD